MTKTAEAQATRAGNGAKPEASPSKKHASFAEALLAAQEEMPAIEPDKTNPHFKSKFVSLGNLLSKVRPVLNRHGLVLTQAPALEDGKFVLRTTITHVSGESMSDSAPLNPTKDDPQGQGSAITYMRRYALSSALAIADQEDDDGNAATASSSPPPELVVRLSPERTERIIGGFKALKLPYKEIGLTLGSCGIDGLTANTAEAIQERIAGLGEVEADKLEVALEKAAQDQETEAPDEPDMHEPEPTSKVDADVPF